MRSSGPLSALLPALLLPGLVWAQDEKAAPWAGDPPALSSLVEFARDDSNLRTAVVRYLQDTAALQRRYPVPYSPVRIERLRKFAESWKQRLAELDFASLNAEGRTVGPAGGTIAFSQVRVKYMMS